MKAAAGTSNSLVENEMDLVDPKDNRRTKRERVDHANDCSIIHYADH